jgi:TPR repeat protein
MIVLSLLLFCLTAVCAQETAVSNDLGATAYNAGMAILKVAQDPALTVDQAKSYLLASEAFAEGVKQGDTDCANELGKLYMFGNGVAWDPVKARDLFQQSADGGNVRGMTNLGMMYGGYRGTPQNHTKAAEWLTKAAELGQPMAQYELARMYSYGERRLVQAPA